MIAEAAWAFGRTYDQPDAGADQPMQSISEEQIDAAARAIRLKLIGGLELGLQSLLRTNFSDGRIREWQRLLWKRPRSARSKTRAVTRRPASQLPGTRRFTLHFPVRDLVNEK